MGYDEVVAIYWDNETFSSCNAVIGLFHELSVQSAGDDVTELIENYRDRLPITSSW